MKTSNKKRSKVTHKVRRLSLSSKKELEARQKAEEFWSDPCWQQPLDQQNTR